MEPVNAGINDTDRDPPRPKLNHKDQLVSSFLKDRSEIYRDLEEVKDDVWKNPQATAHFEKQRHSADDANWSQLKRFFNMMLNIGNAMNAASEGVLSLPRSNARVLDLCMAPGGYTATLLKHSPYAVVCAYTLPQNLGGHKIILRRDSRVKVSFGDITMLHKEYGVEEVPRDHLELPKFSDIRPWLGKRFDLVFCDGQALRTHERYIADYRLQVEAIRLTASQLILAMQRIESGGTLIMLLHNVAAYETIKILHVFDTIAQLQLFKPVPSHAKRSSFYLIAKNIQLGHPKAVAAVNEWKEVWKQLTFPSLPGDGHNTPSKVPNETVSDDEEVSGLLEVIGERIIELGEPIWRIQKKALANTVWTGFPSVRARNQHPDTGQAPTAGTASGAVDENGSDEVAEEAGGFDGADTAAVGERASRSAKNELADSAEVSGAMANLGIHD